MTGWEATLAIAERLERVAFLPSLYSHPIGCHGHALGPSINARGMDLSSSPERDSYLREDYVGLEVHDPGDPGAPLEAGMVVTVEPGLYFPDEGLGVRIEDMVLVTPGGARVLSEALPRTLQQIEQAMSQ